MNEYSFLTQLHYFFMCQTRFSMDIETRTCQI